MCLTVRDSVRGNKDHQPIRELFLLLFLRCGLPRVRYTCSPEAKLSAHWKLDYCTDRILNIAILGQPCEGLRSDCSTAPARTSVLAVDSPNNHVTGLVLDRHCLHRTLAILSCQQVVLPTTFLDLMALLKCFAGQISPTRHPVQKHRLCIISLFLINRAGLQPKKWGNVCHFDFENDIFRLQTQPPPRRDYFDICKLSRDIPIICKRKLRNTWLAGWQILLLQG